MLGVATSAAIGLFTIHPAFAGLPPAPPIFNASLPLPGGLGATAPSLAIDNTGTVFVLASTTSGQGCVLSTYSLDGSTGRFLGRPQGGAGCATSLGPTQQGVSPVNASGELVYGADGPDGVITARSTNAGTNFTTSTLPASGAGGAGAVATDPLVGASGFATSFLIVRDATTGLPRLAVSTDGGLTYTPGGSLINPSDIDVGLWQGAGPMPVVGNLVARRDDTGLKLFAALATADSAADRAAQATAKTDNLNRVYEAVGTVVAAQTPGAAPTVTWHDVAAYAAPAGTGVNRPVPATAVDSAGHVYIAFANGSHVFAKADVDGTHWNASAPLLPLDASASGIPGGLTSSLLPALAAGGNGMVDVVWYGATGGEATAVDPAADVHDNWAVYMAQSINSGATWTAYAVTANAVHQGALCAVGDAACTAAQQTPPDPNIGDALQVAVNQVTGAADIVYDDDSQTAGLPVLQATRQCSGLSAVSGKALVNDCAAPNVASAPVAAGTCPGPQISAAAGAAIDDSPNGSGANVLNLDVTRVLMNEPNSESQIEVVMTVNHLDPQPVVADISSEIWRVFWTFAGTSYYAEARVTAGQQPVFTVGTVGAAEALKVTHRIAGALVQGPSGNVVLTIPAAYVGNPSVGSGLHDFYAASYAVYSGTGSASPAPVLVARAPVGGFGAAPMIGQCPPAADIPDAPTPLLLPFGAAAAGGLVMLLRRKRSRVSVNQEGAGGIPVGSARSSERAE